MVSLELQLLRVFIDNRQIYDQYREAVDVDLFENKPIRRLYYALDELYKSVGDSTSVQALGAYLNATTTNSSTDSEAAEFLAILDGAGIDAASQLTIADTIIKRQTVYEIARRCVSAASTGAISSDGFDTLSSSIRGMLDKHDESQRIEEEGSDFVEGSLRELVESTFQKHGLRWRLASLNRTLGSLRVGDFGFVFARPETGKTTFLADQVSFMATQVPSVYGEERVILHFNNEEQGPKVRLRYMQAALGLPLPELLRDLDGYYRQYLDLTGDRIKIVDSPTITKAQVERLCKKYKPALIIFDQLDKVGGFEADREDLRLGSIYQWAREIAKAYCPVIAVSQADGTGEGVKWLTMANVANAKTAKQAEADWILGIGKQAKEGYELCRYLNISKNKLLGDDDSDPADRHGKMEVIIQPELARYSDG